MLRTPTVKVENMQEQVDDVSRKREPLRNN